MWETLEAHPHAAVKTALEALQLFFEAYEKDAEVRDFFSHPKIALLEKEKVITSMLTSFQAPLEVKHFLTFLVRQNKVEQLPFVLPLLKLIVGRHFKTASVQCTVATPLMEPQKKLLEKDLKDVLKMDHIELQETVDPEILGGVILRMEGELYDASLRTKVRKIQKALT